MTIALVLSGGGSKGDFELGAIRYLYEVKKIQPTLISGTSVGSLNGAKLAEGESSAESGLRGLLTIWLSLDRKEDMWMFEPWVYTVTPIEVFNLLNTYSSTHLFSKFLPSSPPILPQDNLDLGLFRGLRDLANAVTGFIWFINKGIQLIPFISAAGEAQSIANLNPMRNKIFGDNRNSPVFSKELLVQWVKEGGKLRLASVSLDSGNLRFISETGQIFDRKNQPITDKQTRDPVFCDLREAIIASASIGIVFPPVKLGDEYYVDGGHRTVIPVDPVFYPLMNITDAYLVSASPIGLSAVSFENQLKLGNIAVRSLFETFLAEIVQSEIEPRGGWGSRNVTTIAPSYEVHGVLTVDPGLIRINSDYGWMRADDAVNSNSQESRLFQLSNEITYHRARIWFNEGRYLGLFGKIGLGEYTNLPSYRIDLARLVEERMQLDGNMPPLADRWAQIGEAHSTGFGSLPIVNLWLMIRYSLATSLAPNGSCVIYTLDSLVGDSHRKNSEYNFARRVIYSINNQKPIVGNTIEWRVVGRSKLPANARLSCVQSSDGISALFAVDDDGIIVRAELLPDGMGFSGWLPVLDGRSLPGGWVTGVSRRPGSLDIFVIGTDGIPYTAARHSGQPNWSGWWKLPTSIFSPGVPLSVVSRSKDMLDVFGADNAGKIVTAAWSPSSPGWGGWWQVSEGMTSAGGHVAAVTCENDVIDLFTVGLDKTIYTTFWSPTTHPWKPWIPLVTVGRRQFPLGAPISVVSPTAKRIDIAIIEINGRVLTTTLTTPLRRFSGFTQIGTKTFPEGSIVSLISLPNGEMQAYCISSERVIYRAINSFNPDIWSEWIAISGSDPTTPADNSLLINGTITTRDSDAIQVRVFENAIANDAVEFVLEAGPGIDWRKEIVLVEGKSAGTGRWTIYVENNQNRDVNGLYLYQLPGGRLEFKKAKALGVMVEVLQIKIDNVKPGSRIVFTWVVDS
jgi:NTE family protein